MSNTEKITLGDVHFTVFRRLPVPIARQVQTLLIEMAANYEGELSDFETGKVNPREAQNIDMEKLFDIYDLLLTKAVLNPPITKENIDDIEEPMQEHYQDLSDLLLEKYSMEKKRIKKKSMNLQN